MFFLGIPMHTVYHMPASKLRWLKGNFTTLSFNLTSFYHLSSVVFQTVDHKIPGNFRMLKRLGKPSKKGVGSEEAEEVWLRHLWRWAVNLGSRIWCIDVEPTGTKEIVEFRSVVNQYIWCTIMYIDTSKWLQLHLQDQSRVSMYADTPWHSHV